jgi:hypothetical protein
MEEFIPAFAHDDVYPVAKLDEIAELARSEIQIV